METYARPFGQTKFLGVVLWQVMLVHCEENMNINVHIERLVLDGLNIGPDQGAQVKAGVEVELSRLLREGGLLPDFQGGGVIPKVRANPAQISGEATPSSLGQEIARAVYGGIGK